MSKKVAIAYIPVVHQGYYSFLKLLEEKGITELYLVSDDILASHEELDYINRKDRLRALPHDVLLQTISQLTSLTVRSLTIETILALQQDRAHLTLPREDINLFLVETYFGGHEKQYENVFLRWNKENIGEEKEPESDIIALSDFERSALARAIVEAEKSTDWWRHVGAALVKDGKVIAVAHNEHMPEEETPNILGDTRALFKKGMNVNYVTAAHAEVGVLGHAARLGISTEGAELFVTDFPCPYCARLVAKSGIKKIFFMKGYAVLGGDDFFKDMDIETVRVSEDG